MFEDAAFRKRKVKNITSKYGMVSSASSIATDAGVKMLEQGGNAVDAAVATAFCLSVTEPQASGLGGQSMALFYFADGEKMLAVDGSSRAPYGINSRKIPKEPLKSGIMSTTVPSTPATLGYLLEKYGKLSLAEVMEPAIEAAEEGFKITAMQHQLINRESRRLRQDPLAARYLLKNGRALNAGEILRQPELAACLKRLVAVGWQDFYLGKIARMIVKDMEARGGLISQADLSQVPIPIERPVLTAYYRNLRLATFPPPGAGETLVQILNILENFHREELEPETPQAAVILALAFRAALRDRVRMPVNPALYLQSPNMLTLNKNYAAEIAGRFKCQLEEDFSDYYQPPVTAGETTHLSVADSDGNLVGITQSIELVFGSKTTATGLGFFYNNYMSAFDYKDMTHPYYLLPGARPWSSVAPSLVFQQDKPRLLLGSPGSERIATTLAQVITRFFDTGQDLAEAVAGPRLHATDKGKVLIEAKRFPKEVLDMLERYDFQISNRGAYSFYLGCVQAVLVPAAGEDFVGVSDPRRDGSAWGPKKIRRQD